MPVWHKHALLIFTFYGFFVRHGLRNYAWAMESQHRENMGRWRMVLNIPWLGRSSWLGAVAIARETNFSEFQHLSFIPLNASSISLYDRLTLSLQELEAIDLSPHPDAVMRNQIAHYNGEALHLSLIEQIRVLERRLETACLHLTAERDAHQETRDALAAATAASSAQYAEAVETVRVMRANSSDLERALADARAYSSQLEERLKKTAGADGSSVDETYAWEKAIERERSRCEDRDEQLWHWPPYGGHRASDADCLDRFQQVMLEFSTRECSKVHPVTVLSIPWPVLCAASSIGDDTINEINIHAFFTYAKKVLSKQEYRKCLSTTRIQFHPDRWRSRGIPQTFIFDHRELILGLVTKISQIVNALFDELQ
ncbi:hypothetical protein BDZ89DRAFT_1054166 [Hymenopellis radicata]|nr:hypothetical protein BDZ89DRAFT_1054166 [Hymenopellis radicata]